MNVGYVFIYQVLGPCSLDSNDSFQPDSNGWIDFEITVRFVLS